MGRSRLCCLLLVTAICTAGSRARRFQNQDFFVGSKQWDDFNTAALSASSYASLGIQPSGFVSDTAQGQGRHAQDSFLPVDQPRKVIVIGCSGDGCSSPEFAPANDHAEITAKQTYESGNLNAYGGQYPAKQNLVAGSTYQAPPSYQSSSYTQSQATSYYSSSSQAEYPHLTSDSQTSYGSAYNSAPSYGTPSKASLPVPSYSSPGSSQSSYPGYGTSSATAQSLSSYNNFAKQASSSPSAYNPGSLPSNSGKFVPNSLPAPSTYQVPSRNSAASSGSVSNYGAAGNTNVPSNQASSSPAAYNRNSSPSDSGQFSQNESSAPPTNQVSSYNSAASYGSSSGYGGATHTGAASKQSSNPASSYNTPGGNAYNSKPVENSPSYQVPVRTSSPSYDSPSTYGTSAKAAPALPSYSSQPTQQSTVKTSYNTLAPPAPVTTPTIYRNPVPTTPDLSYLPPQSPAAAPSYVAPVNTIPVVSSRPSPTTTPPPVAPSYYGNPTQLVPAPAVLPPQASNLVTSTLKPPTTSTSPPRSTPKAEIPLQSPGIADLPFPGCAAALKCVKEEYCDMLGVMVNTPVKLTPILRQFRVPLMSCLMLETNEVGFCCRDPLYNDPWPADMPMPMPNMAPKLPAPQVSPVVSQPSASGTVVSYQPPLSSPQPITPPPVHYLPPTTSVYVAPPISTTASPPAPLPLVPAVSPTSKCGVSKNSRHRVESGEAEAGEFPWHALLLADNGTSLCSAALVGEKYAVTAAHCIAGMDPSKLRIRLGEHRLGPDNPTPYHEAAVSAAVAHPDFQEGSLFNDIALIFFKNPGVRDQRIGKVCLPKVAREQQTTGSCLTTGWGRPVVYGQVSGVLNKAEVPVISRQECENKLQTTHLGKYFKLHQSFTCAGSSSNLNTCKIDDGSPLVCQRSDGSYVLSGVSSWSAARCNTQMPMVFADVATFSDWLNAEMSRSENELVNNSNAAFQTSQDFRAQFGSGAGYGR